MQAWVEKLVELQDIDLKIAKLELQLGELPKRQAEAELQYKAEADALAAATNDLKQAEVAAKGIETQITTAREKKRDFQAKTITIKNNDEYRAAILQIEMMDKAIADLEEKQIEAMILIDRRPSGRPLWRLWRRSARRMRRRALRGRTIWRRTTAFARPSPIRRQSVASPIWRTWPAAVAT